MDEITTRSTSSVTAEVTDMVLREKMTTRLIFRPMLLDNKKEPEASVKGHFLYQRKSSSGAWEDFDTIPFSSLKSGEGYKLEIKSGELLKLYEGIRDLYELHSEEGVPWGERKFIKATPDLKLLASLSSEDIRTFLSANESVGSSLLCKLLTWAIEVDEPIPLVERFLAIDPSSLKKLNAAVSLQSLKVALNIWEENQSSGDEDFWQRILTENSFVLEQVFAWPTTIHQDKAYVGGKDVTNKGGNIVDFLMKNYLTLNASLIEIKTPSTPMLGSEYRNGIFNLSSELTGSAMQVLNYKRTLQEQYLSVTQGQTNLFQSFDPKCAVIIGNTQNLDTKEKRKSFELYRQQMHGVAIVTFDELYEKTRKLIQLMETSERNEISSFDNPF